jgi:hypothetical protein
MYVRQVAQKQTCCGLTNLVNKTQPQVQLQLFAAACNPHRYDQKAHDALFPPFDADTGCWHHCSPTHSGAAGVEGSDVKDVIPRCCLLNDSSIDS